MQGPRTRSLVVGALLWLVVCVAGAFVVLARLGDRGSVLPLLAGIAMGVLGALTHVILSSFRGYRRLGFFRRGLLNALCTYLPLVATGAALQASWGFRLRPGDLPELARILVLYTGAPLLALALLVALVTSATRGQAGPDAPLPRRHRMPARADELRHHRIPEPRSGVRDGQGPSDFS